MDMNTIRVAEACEWIRTPSGLLRSLSVRWIRTPSGLLRYVNG